jgi:FkbM family methyltransferase
MLTRLLKRIAPKAYRALDEIIFDRLGYPAVCAEKISKSKIRPYLPNNPVIIDCGAHDGTDSILLSKVLQGTVHAFEPVPSIFTRLVQNTSRYQIQCYQTALSATNGTATFFLSSGTSDASSSLLKPKEHLIDHPTVTFEDHLTVQTSTLDHWAAQYGIASVDLLWLDMQGAELKMLAASKTILPTVKVIHSEVSTKETYEGTCTYNQLADFLKSHGFTVMIEAIPHGADMGNVLFVRL